MATNKKIELTANQLWVLKYILHEVELPHSKGKSITRTDKKQTLVGDKGGSAPTGLTPLPTPNNSRLWQRKYT